METENEEEGKPRECFRKPCQFNKGKKENECSMLSTKMYTICTRRLRKNPNPRPPTKTQTAIIEAMKELCKESDDTVWLTDHETVFDRLASIFLVDGGTVEQLKENFPDNF